MMMSFFRRLLYRWLLKRRLSLARRLAQRADQGTTPRGYAKAAEAYEAALAVAPSRLDIRVQYANMLKDARRLSEAEAVYRSTLQEKPDDADLHLQLGHCLNLQGRRLAALEEYGRAGRLAPFWIAPQRELFQMGQRRSQEYLFEAQLRLGGVEAITEMTQRMLDLRGTLDRLIEALPDIQAQTAFPVSCYDLFRATYDVPSPPPFPIRRSFAVIMLADREPLAALYAQLASLEVQHYQSWTFLAIGRDPARRRAVERVAPSDARIRWFETRDDETTAQAECRAALSSEADWVVLLAERALLHPRAIEWFAFAAARGAAVAFVADEEASIRDVTLVRRSSPEFRQVVDYDTLLEMNTFGETLAVERAVYADAVSRFAVSSVSAARSALLLTLARDGRVGHIPCPLVCRDGGITVDRAAAIGAQEEAVRAHIGAYEPQSRIAIGRPTGPLPRSSILWRPQEPDAAIAVIIATRDNGSDVARFVDSLRRTAAVPSALRILIVDNGSRQAETRGILAGLAKNPWAEILLLEEPFNWSRLNNRAVETVDGSLLLFANDDMIMLSERWDERLRGLLERPEIGAVGARLLYSDDTVQHGGILFGWKGSVIHDGVYESALEPGPASRWQVSRAVGAVTGAFLATRREVFLAHQGFDEVGLPVAFSDIDYALKLRASGLRILWTPEITLYHHESKTRGLDHLDEEKQARAAAEHAVIAARWGAAVTMDPGLNPVWHMATMPFRLLSAPSQSRLLAHIERCAARNPWLPPTNSSQPSLRNKPGL
jgi:O-antigen biosynthesis protein